MSIEIQVAIGTYLLVEVPTKVEARDHCTDHGRHETHRHCPACGREAWFEAVTTHADDEWWGDIATCDNLVEAHIDRPQVADSIVRVLISNARGVGGMSFDPKFNHGIWDLPDRDETEAGFMREHADDIKALEAMGCTVIVTWGVLSWDR